MAVRPSWEATCGFPGGPLLSPCIPPPARPRPPAEGLWARAGPTVKTEDRNQAQCCSDAHLFGGNKRLVQIEQRRPGGRLTVRAL